MVGLGLGIRVFFWAAEVESGDDGGEEVVNDLGVSGSEDGFGGQGRGAFAECDVEGHGVSFWHRGRGGAGFV